MVASHSLPDCNLVICDAGFNIPAARSVGDSWLAMTLMVETGP